MFPWQRYIPACTHDIISHSSVAKQQQSLLCMVLYIAYSDEGQFIACMCQISLVYVSTLAYVRYMNQLSVFLADPRITLYLKIKFKYTNDTSCCYYCLSQCSLAVPVLTEWVYAFVVLCPGTPEGSTGSGSGFKVSQKTGQRLKVSSDRLGEAWNRICDPWFTGHRFIHYTTAAFCS